MRSCGKATASAPSRSASSRAWRAAFSSSALVTMERLARVWVSSRRTTMSPAFTRLPSRTRNSPTTPPVGCCTFLTLELTTSCPGATTAPEISVLAAQPPRPTTSTTDVTPIATICRRSARCRTWIRSLMTQLHPFAQRLSKALPGQVAEASSWRGPLLSVRTIGPSPETSPSSDRRRPARSAGAR
jgi:hypothetical protein